MENSKKLIITPKTKVSQLLEAYPELEDVLIEYTPAFKKLKNPVLRKTVTKITSLQQAAAVGSVNVEDLINRLREAIGQDAVSIEKENRYETEKPAWFDENKIVMTLDVRKMLAEGEHPVNQVVSDLKKLRNGEIFKMIAPFLTAPLIDKASSLNFKHWIRQVKDNEFEIYFALA
jgi:hypothetical protein